MRKKRKEKEPSVRDGILAWGHKSLNHRRHVVALLEAGYVTEKGALLMAAYGPDENYFLARCAYKAETDAEETARKKQTAIRAKRRRAA